MGCGVTLINSLRGFEAFWKVRSTNVPIELLKKFHGECESNQKIWRLVLSFLGRLFCLKKLLSSYKV